MSRRRMGLGYHFSIDTSTGRIELGDYVDAVAYTTHSFEHASGERPAKRLHYPDAVEAEARDGGLPELPEATDG